MTLKPAKTVSPVVFALTFLVFVSVLLSGSIAQAVDYRVGEGDVLRISVYGHKDLNTTERVSGEGNMIFPLLGQINVDGLSVPAISNLLAHKLSDGYIISPQVSVFIVEFRSRKAVIMGEVVRPGLYELKGRTSFLELVSMAGGITRDAGETATIKRIGADDKIESITIDLAGLFSGSDVSSSMNVLDGDTLYITKAGIFYVTGEVRRPNAYKYTDDTSIIKAITKAGGFTDRASEKKVRIVRKTSDGEQVLENVAMDELILPDDVIVVPESLF